MSRLTDALREAGAPVERFAVPGFGVGVEDVLVWLVQEISKLRDQVSKLEKAAAARSDNKEMEGQRP